MNSESSPNPFFRPPRESTWGEDEVRGQIRAEFYDVRQHFLRRLACAQVFDSARFEALLLWLDALQRSCAAATVPMAASDFDEFTAIANHLEQEATYSRDQRAECAKAYERWLNVMRRFGLSHNGAAA